MIRAIILFLTIFTALNVISLGFIIADLKDELNSKKSGSSLCSLVPTLTPVEK